MTVLIAWLKIKIFTPINEFKASTKVSVLIPVRNEAGNIEALLNDLMKQSYPKFLFEVLVINDDSDDETVSLVKKFIPKAKFSLQLLHLTPVEKRITHKKDAISLGVKHATGELIACTDGDCNVAKDWLSSLVGFYKQTNAKFISGAVSFHRPKSFFEIFQCIEFASLIGTGAAFMQLKAGNMCNGANLAYPKRVFEEVGGYQNSPNIPSGDDEFLLQKVKQKYPNELFFLKSQAHQVKTNTHSKLSSFFQQRKRWSSKWNQHKDWKVSVLAIFIFLYHLSCLISLFFALLSDKIEYKYFFFVLMGKIILEFVFLALVMKHFKQSYLWIWIPFIQLIYSFYVVFFAILPNKKNYLWKGRKV